jgi:hypothetical protein
MIMTEQSPAPYAAGDRTNWSDLLAAHLFRTPYGGVFCDVATNRGIAAVPIYGEEFRAWLRLTLKQRTGVQPTKSALASIIEQIKAYAWQHAPIENVHLRVAHQDGRVYLDLADEHGRVVEVRADGWTITDSPPVHFVRPLSMRPLPVPERGGSIEDLGSIVNVVDDADFVWIVAFLLGALRNAGPHPLLVIRGGEGAAKTTLVEILLELIDPRWAPLSGLPSTERGVLESDNGYLRVYDNVPSISARTSDALCRMSTGRPAHPVIINGIGELVMRADLSDRSLFVNLALVADRQRRSLREIWTEFERLRPKILGVLLGAVAHGLRALPTTRLDEMPRMADFAIWATACEGAFWPKCTFMSAYMENRTEAVENLIETDAVATAVRTLMVNRSRWSGTATELDRELRNIPGNPEKFKGWPAEPRILSTRLRGHAPSLSKLGIMVSFDKVGHDRKRVITLTIEADRPDPPIGRTSLASTGGAVPDAVPDGEGDREITGSVRNVRNTDFSTTTRPDAADAADGADAADQTETRVQADDAGDADGADRRAGDRSIIFDRAIQHGDRIIPIYKVRNRGVAKRKIKRVGVR